MRSELSRHRVGVALSSCTEQELEQPSIQFHSIHSNPPDPNPHCIGSSPHCSLSILASTIMSPHKRPQPSLLHLPVTALHHLPRVQINLTQAVKQHDHRHTPRPNNRHAHPRPRILTDLCPSRPSSRPLRRRHSRPRAAPPSPRRPALFLRWEVRLGRVS